jgi:hypothetical protein
VTSTIREEAFLHQPYRQVASRLGEVARWRNRRQVGHVVVVTRAMATRHGKDDNVLEKITKEQKARIVKAQKTLE